MLSGTFYEVGPDRLTPPNPRTRTRTPHIVVIFCGSKKSIDTGIPMAAVLFAHKDVSLIVLPAMLFLGRPESRPQHQGGRGPFGDHESGYDGLAGSGWGEQDAVGVGEHGQG